MKPLNLSLLAVLATAAPLTAIAGSSSKHHSMMETSEVQAAQTGGQAAFAEIAQITAELRADPSTDWTKVDIDGLRDHLIDMNNVTLHANVSAEPTQQGAIFTVTGKTADIVQSIQNMTEAHGMMMAGEGFSWATEVQSDGTIVTVEAADENGAAMIQGLGLFGLMTLGDHHANHHRLMARGVNAH